MAEARRYEAYVRRLAAADASYINAPQPPQQQHAAGAGQPQASSDEALFQPGVDLLQSLGWDDLDVPQAFLEGAHLSTCSPLFAGALKRWLCCVITYQPCRVIRARLFRAGVSRPGRARYAAALTQQALQIHAVAQLEASCSTDKRTVLPLKPLTDVSAHLGRFWACQIYRLSDRIQRLTRRRTPSFTCLYLEDKAGDTQTCSIVDCRALFGRRDAGARRC